MSTAGFNEAQATMSNVKLPLKEAMSGWEPVFLWRLLRAKGWKAVARHIHERKSNHSYVLSTTPPVVLLVWGRDDSPLHWALKKLPLTVLYLFFWDINDSKEDIARSIRGTLSRFSNHRIVCLCNEAHQSEQFAQLGIEAIFFNHNALVHEGIFQPSVIPEKKRWDAFYNAQLAPFKRIELAAKVNSLCMATYRYAGAYDSSYEKKVKASMPNTFWANDNLKGGVKLKPTEIVTIIRQAHCGLCLSETEGAMFASMEYLLTGLPVVSTPSRGGRSAFFNQSNAIICQPDPDMVTEGVIAWKERDVDPRAIRELTLRMVHEHRERLIEFLLNLKVQIQFPWFPMLNFKKHCETSRLLISA